MTQSGRSLRGQDVLSRGTRQFSSQIPVTMASPLLDKIWEKEDPLGQRSLVACCPSSPLALLHSPRAERLTNVSFFSIQLLQKTLKGLKNVSPADPCKVNVELALALALDGVARGRAVFLHLVPGHC